MSERHTAVELATQGGGEAGYHVRFAIHSRIDHIVVLDDERDLRVTITLVRSISMRQLRSASN